MRKNMTLIKLTNTTIIICIMTISLIPTSKAGPKRDEITESSEKQPKKNYKKADDPIPNNQFQGLSLSDALAGVMRDKEESISMIENSEEPVLRAPDHQFQDEAESSSNPPVPREPSMLELSAIREVLDSYDEAIYLTEIITGQRPILDIDYTNTLTDNNYGTFNKAPVYQKSFSNSKRRMKELKDAEEFEAKANAEFFSRDHPGFGNP